VVQVPIMLGLALLFALLLDSKVVKGKTFFRLTYFMPFAVPGLVAALIWGYLYSPQLSVIVQVAGALGLPKPDFLGDNWILWSIANITTWEWTGYNMIILTAALQAIPQELYEAARIDGCTGLGVARYIKVPLVRGGLVLTCVLSIIGSLQLFQEPYILGTMTTISDNYTPNIYAYNYAFSYSAFNYSAAIAFTLAFVAFIFSYGFFRIAQRGQEG
jgi:multiple sugar transport system permease protein